MRLCILSTEFLVADAWQISHLGQNRTELRKQKVVDISIAAATTKLEKGAIFRSCRGFCTSVGTHVTMARVSGHGLNRRLSFKVDKKLFLYYNFDQTNNNKIQTTSICKVILCAHVSHSLSFGFNFTVTQSGLLLSRKVSRIQGNI